MLPARYTLVLLGLTAALAALCAPDTAQAQTLTLNPPHASAKPNDILTFDLVAVPGPNGGIGAAVGWGTDITLLNNTVNIAGQDVPVLKFVPNYGGPGQPFKPLQPFFDTDFSDQSDYADGMLHLEYVNFNSPGAVLGQNGLVTLGEFQLQMLNSPGPCTTDPNVPCNAVEIQLSDLGIPPDGSAVQDADGNNLLLQVESSSVTLRPPTPEPAGWLTLTGGVVLGLLWGRRRRRA